MEGKLKERLIAKFPGKQSEIDREFNKLANHRYFRSLLRGFPLDEEVHYPNEDRNSYSSKEILEAVETVEEFRNFVEKLTSNTG